MIFLIVLCLVLLIALVYISYTAFKFAKIILAFEEQIEESLDMLDRIYARVAHISEMPILVNDPIVREMVFLVQEIKNSILLIANKMTKFNNKDQNEKQEQEDDKKA